MDKLAASTTRVWHHLGFTWDELQGVRVVIDGATVLSNLNAGSFHMGYAAIGNLAVSGGQFDELYVFDKSLNDGELDLLRKNGADSNAPPVAARPSVEPPRGSPESRRTGLAAGAREAYRRKDLGWDDTAAFIPITGPTRIRILEISDARELRNYGWRSADGIEDSAWPRSYKGYYYLGGGGLHIDFARPETFDYVRKRGYMDQARLTAGGAWRRPSNAVDILRFTGSNFISTWPVAVADKLTNVSVYLEQQPSEYYRSGKQLHDIAFLQAAPLGNEPRPANFTAFLRKTVPPSGIAGQNRARLTAWYRPEERIIISGDLRPEQGGKGPAQSGTLTPLTMPVEAWRAVHLMTAAPTNDLPLNAVRVKLAVDGWKPGTKINLLVHDPNNPWRALADVDVELQQGGLLDLTLEFAPTILPAGAECWLTMVGSQPGRLLCGDKDSSISLYGPPMAEALQSYQTWQHRILHDYFQSLSEPRPWGANNLNNENNLRVITPQYDAIARLVNDLNRRFPEDRITRGYMIYTHPQDGGYWNQLPVVYPSEPGAPRWAVLQKSIFGMFLEFINWWIDERQTPNGECGGKYGDDTDLMQDFPAIALVHDPDHKYRQAVRKLADYAWKWHMRDGLPIGMNSFLYVYEGGINAQVCATLMDYGNPILVERLMATARRYDGFLFTPAVDGKRKPRGSSCNYKEIVGNPAGASTEWLLHPGLVLMWYNSNPTLRQLMTEYFDGNRDRFPTNSPVFPRRKCLPQMLYMQTGDTRFVIDRGLENAFYRDPFWTRIMNLSKCPTHLLGKLTNDFAYGKAPHTDLGGDQDYATLAPYVGWHYTRDKNVLIPPLEFVYKVTYYTLPLLTEAQQSNDRVAIKKSLTDFMYLGGIPVSREGQHTPYFAVSYENLTPDFAAMVLDDTPEFLRWVGYAFAPGGQSGMLRVWNLAPGTYRVRQGIDADGDDRIDGKAEETTTKLKRHEAIPITLPGRKLWIVEAECLAKETPLHERCDLAVSAEDAELQEGQLTVVAHNLGCKATGPFAVKVSDANGKELAVQKDAVGLESAADLIDRKKSFVFTGDFNRLLMIAVSGPLEEITECNNSAVLPDTRSK